MHKYFFPKFNFIDVKSYKDTRMTIILNKFLNAVACNTSSLASNVLWSIFFQLSSTLETSFLLSEMCASPIQEVTKPNKGRLRHSTNVLLQTAQRTAAHFIFAATLKSQSCCENMGKLLRVPVHLYITSFAGVKKSFDSFCFISHNTHKNTSLLCQRVIW